LRFVNLITEEHIEDLDIDGKNNIKINFRHISDGDVKFIVLAYMITFVIVV
jgi:hypothetical protein